jgi:group I intron endonuclease
MVNKKCGVYKITNTFNSKIYVGSSIDINKRWNEHKRNLSNNKHDNDYLQKSWNKFGKSNFIFEIIEVITDKYVLIEREQYYLDLLKPYDKTIGYNICKTAGNMLGFKHSEKTKKLMSSQKKGKQYSLGYKHTDETKLIMSISHNGLKHNQKIIIKMINKAKKDVLTSIKYKTTKVSTELKNKIINDYKTNIFSTRQLSKKYNIPKSTIWNIVRE